MVDDAQAVVQPQTEGPVIQTRSFSKGLLLTVSSTGVSVISLFLETMLAARSLPTDHYGVYVLLLVVVMFYGVLVDFGAKTAVTQMIAGGDRERQTALVNTALIFRLLVVIILAGLIWLVGDWQAVFDPSRSLLQYSAYIPIMLAVMTFDELLLSILQGFQMYKPLAIAQVLRSLLRLMLTTVFLVVFHMGVLALIYSWMISYGICIIYEFIMVPTRKWMSLDRPLLGELLRFGMPLQGTRFVWFLFARVDVLLLGTLGGPVMVAFYGVASRVPDALQRLAESYFAVYFPTVSSLLSTQRRQQAHWFLNHSLRLISFLAALAALVAVVFNREIVTLLFSEKYVDSAPVFALLMVAFHMTFTANLMGYTLTAAKRAGLSFGTNLLRVVTHIASDLVLIPLYGSAGPSVASNISGYVNSLANVLMLRHIGIKVEAWPYVKQTALLLGCVALFVLVQPQSFMLRVGIVILFAAANLLLATISFDDFSLILPGRVVRRRRAMSGETIAEVPVNS